MSIHYQLDDCTYNMIFDNYFLFLKPLNFYLMMLLFIVILIVILLIFSFVILNETNLIIEYIQNIFYIKNKNNTLLGICITIMVGNLSRSLNLNGIHTEFATISGFISTAMISFKTNLEQANQSSISNITNQLNIDMFDNQMNFYNTSFYNLESNLISNVIDLNNLIIDRGNLSLILDNNYYTQFIVSNTVYSYNVASDKIVEILSNAIQDKFQLLKILQQSFFYIIIGFFILSILGFVFFIRRIHLKNIKIFTSFLLINDFFISKRIRSLKLLEKLGESLQHTNKTIDNELELFDTQKVIKTYRKKNFKNKSFLPTYKFINLIIAIMVLFLIYLGISLFFNSKIDLFKNRLTIYDYYLDNFNNIQKNFIYSLISRLPDSVTSYLIPGNIHQIVKPSSSITNSVGLFYYNFLNLIDGNNQSYSDSFNSMFWSSNFCSFNLLPTIDTSQSCMDRQNNLMNRGFSGVLYFIFLENEKYLNLNNASSSDLFSNINFIC